MAKSTLFKGIVYLSQEQYNKLIALGAIEVNGKVIEYDESILYVTPQTLPDDYYTIDNSSITKNGSGQIQTTGVIDQNTGNANKEWTGTQAQYDALVKKDPDMLYYITDGKSLPSINNLTLTVANSVISSDEKFTHHVHVMLEFETDGVHGGTDFILHPFDTSICFVTYDILVNGQLYSSQAYLDEAGNIKINVPTGLTFTNVKGHYIEYGG